MHLSSSSSNFSLLLRRPNHSSCATKTVLVVSCGLFILVVASAFPSVSGDKEASDKVAYRQLFPTSYFHKPMIRRSLASSDDERVAVIRKSGSQPDRSKSLMMRIFKRGHINNNNNDLGYLNQNDPIDEYYRSILELAYPGSFSSSQRGQHRLEDNY